MQAKKSDKEKSDKEEFEEEFWKNKVGTWQTLSAALSTEFIGPVSLLAKIKFYHNLLVGDKDLRTQVASNLGDLLGDTLKGEYCIRSFLNPKSRQIDFLEILTTANGQKWEKPRDTNVNNINFLYNRNMLDLTFEGPRESNEDKRLSSLVTPDYALVDYLINPFDIVEQKRAYKILKTLKDRKDVILFLMKKTEKKQELVMMVKCRADSKIPYLRNKWVLPYSFVPKASNTARSISDMNARIGQINLVKRIIYLPPLKPGGNPIISFMGTNCTSDCKKIEKLMTKPEFNISKIDYKTIDDWWNLFKEGTEEFHYGSIITLGEILKERKTEKRIDKIIQQKLKDEIEGDDNMNEIIRYFELTKRTNELIMEKSLREEQKLNKLTKGDPYRSDSDFLNSRQSISECLEQMEQIKGDPEERTEQVITIFNNAGRKGDGLKIPAIGPHKAQKIVNIIKKYNPKAVYEIGTLYGYSAIIFAKSLPDDGYVVTIDKSEENLKIAKRIINATGCSDRVRTVLGDATKLIPEFKDGINMLFIDGYKREYLKYLKVSEPSLKSGSVIVADNVMIYKQDMEDFLDYIKTSDKYRNIETIKAKRAFTDDSFDEILFCIKK